MSERRIVSQSDRVVVLEEAPEVVYVERSTVDANETMIVQGVNRGSISATALIALLFCFLLAVGLFYAMATSDDEDNSATDDLNLSIDVASPSLPTVTIPTVRSEASPVIVERQVIEIQKSEPPAQMGDAAIQADEPLEPVEPTQSE